MESHPNTGFFLLKALAAWSRKVNLVCPLATLTMHFPAEAGEADKPKRALALHSFNIFLTAHLEAD
jgi:hypothetical protein